jgi:redox-sensing transcriptional repressor
VIIGAGNLGNALAAYSGFARYGLRVVAVFDTDPQKVGLEVAGVPVLPLKALESEVTRREVELAILCLPASAAQVVANRLVRAGVRAIWNFAPAYLQVPDEVIVRHEQLAIGLGVLFCRLAAQGERPSPRHAKAARAGAPARSSGEGKHGVWP